MMYKPVMVRYFMLLEYYMHSKWSGRIARGADTAPLSYYTGLSQCRSTYFGDKHLNDIIYRFAYE